MSEGSRENAEESAETALRSRVKAALFDGESLNRLGRFEIVERLGAGGMGVVYRARDPSLDRDVAIKVLASFGSLGTSGRTRLQREARAMAKLSHPNVAHVYEVAAEGDEVYVAMEYIDGPTLRAWTQAHHGESAAVLAMYRAAGEGLCAAHQAGFVHRDFKPDNVLVGSDERPRVLDFGLATALADRKQELDETRPPEVVDLEKSLTATGTILGTPAYMAPEQFLGKATDERTDQFAFCVALWEALTGSRPFGGGSFDKLRDNVVHERLPSGPIDGLSPKIEAALRRGLSADPERRFPTMRALLDVLSASAPASRNAWMVIAGAAVALLGFAMLSGNGPADEAAAPIEEPTETPEAAPVGPAPLELEIITNTSGYGVHEAHLHPDGRRYLYRAEGAYWLAEIGGGLPKRLELPPGEYRSVRFHGPDQYVALRDDGGPVAFLAGKAARPLHFKTPPKTGVIALSPSATAMLSATADGVWLGNPNDDPVRLIRNQIPFAMAWSPDGQRFAALTEQTESGTQHLSLFTVAGKLIAREPVSLSSALAWVGPTRLVTSASENGHPVGLQCFDATNDGLRAGAIVPVPALETPRYSVRGSAAGRLLFEVETSTRRDVAIGSFDDPSSRHEVAPGLPARNWAPEWLDERRLALVSDRFGRGMVFVHDVETRRTGDPFPLEDYHVRDCSPYDRGRLLCRVSVRDGTISLATFDADSGSWTLLDAAEAWAPTAEAVGCTREGRCVVSTAKGGTVNLRSLDPGTGSSEALRACPPEVACRFRWTLSPDGGQLVTRTAAQDRLARLDLATGDVHTDAVPDSEDYIVQSAMESHGRVIASQMSSDAAGEIAPTYRIVSVVDGQTEVLVGHDNEWMVAPRISPDAERFAFGFLSFHFELATADASGLCR